MFHHTFRPLASAFAIAVLSAYAGHATAADHGDAPVLSSDRGADVNDCFAFQDPNNNFQTFLGFTVHGFIPSGELVNFSVFDPLIRYSFRFQNTGNAAPDNSIDLSFSRRTSTGTAQTATITFSGGLGGQTFTAPVTNPTLATVAPTRVVTTIAPNLRFFAGVVDDPFFFDIPAFSRFIASVATGPDVSVFNRARDSFAGYNTLAIAFSVPTSMLTAPNDPASPTVAVECRTARQSVARRPDGTTAAGGEFRQLDRMGNPAVNVALIPFARKDAHSSGTTRFDERGDFTADITGTMNFLGTNSAIQNAILDIVARRGDYLRLDTSVPNTGTNPEAAFPNGRRLTDDTVDTLLFLLTNTAYTAGDNVDASDIAPRVGFPFFAPPQQPRVNGVIDDNTRN